MNGWKKRIRLLAIWTALLCLMFQPAEAAELKREEALWGAAERGMAPAIFAAGPAYTLPNFPVILQTPELPTGCEITALTMAMRYYGCGVGKTVMARQYLPTVQPNFWYGSDGRLYGPDMDRYFVGDPFTSWGYICGTPAICTAANQYFKDHGTALEARDLTGYTPERLYELVGEGIPVVVWVTIDMVNRYADFSWYTSSGKYMSMSHNDHGAVLVGYSPTTVTIADPLAGQVTYSRSRFESVFRSRGNQCVALFRPEVVYQSGYTDVPDDAWYAGAVAYCRENGLMSGVGNKRFQPGGEMTRGMLATVLYRIAGKPQASGENPFEDVLPGQWYTQGVLWANETGVATGYGGGRFGTADPVTREQIVAELWRYEGRPAAQSGADFADEAEISAYAAAAVDWAKERGIIQGKGGNRFDPGSSATRAEVATILRNYMDMEREDPPDPAPTAEPPAISPEPEKSS